MLNEFYPKCAASLDLWLQTVLPRGQDYFICKDNLSINMEQYPENHDHLKNCVTVPSVTL
ncbi:hypothetical protein DPMN_020159 [Dreissena polymorpha]|uniref:Uncharacterized protein n=1 Tax=Dreissena polymorpha TaxID=45954 RepID=A0A9D4NKJ1_DREPO|nr:hypothetical protein DPMN_020159 [Dreissena polymorpha]